MTARAPVLPLPVVCGISATYLRSVKALTQHPLAVLPAALEAARGYALPGREAATVNAVHWALHALLLQDPVPEPPPARVTPFPHRG
jgi:hypothetical protein